MLFHCLDPSKTGCCLDLGSDWGTNAFSLTRYYDQVWSLEAVKQKIEFQKIRQEQDRVNNIRFISADWSCLPFPENYFDLIAANDVLEWVDLSNYSKNPRKFQLDALRRIRKILKPSGCLYIGIKNRFGINLLSNVRNHRGLPVTKISPRKITELLVKGKFRKDRDIEETWNDYRSYAYSFFGYEKILKKAGFSHVDIYWTMDYNKPHFSGKFDGESFSFFLNFLKKNMIRTHSIGSLPMFLGAHAPPSIIKIAQMLVSPSFLIFAHNGDKSNSFESKLIQLKEPTSSFLKMSGSMSTTSKISYFLLENGRPHAIVKFPRFKQYASLETEEEKMSQFNQLKIEKKNIDSITVFVEPFINAIPCQPHNFLHNRAVLSWLLNFQDKTQHGFWDFSQFKSKVEILKNIVLDIPIEDRTRLLTLRELDLFLETLRNVKLSKTSEHGDFFAGNILIDKTNKVYVTDWELYKEEGEPLFDFTLFILDCASEWSSPQAFREAFSGRGKYAPILKSLISEFCETKKFPPELVLQAIPYTILRCIYRRAFGADNKHLQIAPYMSILEAWGKMRTSITPNLFSTY